MELYKSGYPTLFTKDYPNVTKAGGLQSQGVKGENVVGYLDPLTTQDLKFSGFPDVLGRSSKSEAQRVNNTGD